MTYLDLVNSVLRRMRENEVSSVASDSYSKLIGEFVNDAKTFVENAWDWSALRKTVTVTTTDNVVSYELTGTNNSFSVLDVINDTSNVFMRNQSSSWMNKVYLVDDPVKGSPDFFSYNGVSSAGESIVDLYPKPDKAYTLRFNIVDRPDRMTEDTDTLLVPSSAVIQFATAFAARERGEQGGTSAAELSSVAQATLADAIAMDASRFPHETIWTD
jgi:hypothetical protein